MMIDTPPTPTSEVPTGEEKTVPLTTKTSIQAEKPQQEKKEPISTVMVSTESTKLQEYPTNTNSATILVKKVLPP